jgi:tRNA(fMet)-specific endonuclease VapC
MSTYLLDTNHLGAALNDHSQFFDRVFRERRRGHRFGTCFPVLCELEAGVRQTPDPDANHRALSRILRQIRTWPLERFVAEEYGILFVELRRSGIALSQVDLMLAAMARTNRLTILSTDRDFERVPGIRVENWLAS